MKNSTRVSIAALALAISGAAFADTASIDFRHSYNTDSRMHSDRIKLNYRMDNGLGFEGELKYKVAGDRKDKAFDNTVSNGHEFIVSYQYRIAPNGVLTPAFNIESDENKTSYKWNLKYQHKLNELFYVAGRYRYQHERLDRDKIDRNVADRGKDNHNINRFDGRLGFTPEGPWTVEYQFSYFDTDYIRYDNKKSDYEQNLITRYRINKNWRPFFEVGDIKVTSTSDDRQLRLRAGVQYQF